MLHQAHNHHSGCGHKRGHTGSHHSASDEEKNKRYKVTLYLYFLFEALKCLGIVNGLLQITSRVIQVSKGDDEPLEHFENLHELKWCLLALSAAIALPDAYLHKENMGVAIGAKKAGKKSCARTYLEKMCVIGCSLEATLIPQMFTALFQSVFSDLESAYGSKNESLIVLSLTFLSLVSVGATLPVMNKVASYTQRTEKEPTDEHTHTRCYEYAEKWRSFQKALCNVFKITNMCSTVIQPYIDEHSQWSYGLNAASLTLSVIFLKRLYGYKKASTRFYAGSSNSDQPLLHPESDQPLLTSKNASLTDQDIKFWAILDSMLLSTEPAAFFALLRNCHIIPSIEKINAGASTATLCMTPPACFLLYRMFEQEKREISASSAPRQSCCSGHV